MTDLTVAVARCVDEIGEGPLRNVVEQGTGGTLFHRYGWLRAVEAGLDWEPRHLVVRKGSNPLGVLPNFARTVSLPHDGAERLADVASLEALVPPPPGYGGPAVTGDEETVLEELLDAVPSMWRHSTLYHRIQTYDVGEIRHGRLLEAHGYEPRLDQCTFLLDLDADWATIRDRMDGRRRRAIQRGTELPHEVTATDLGEDLSRTHRMYAQNMDRVGGETLPPSFFEALAEHLPDRTRVFRATVDDREVGRYVHLLDEEGSVLHHWLSAIPDSDHFEDYPSELLHRRAIRWGIEQGYDHYSFGPTAPHFTDSVFRFKEQYGGRAVPLLCWELGTLPVAWRAYKAGRSWYQRSQVKE